LAGQSAAGAPEESGTLYTNPASGFSLRYPQNPDVITDAGGISLTYPFDNGGTSVIQITGGTTGGATAQTAVQAVAAQAFPGAVPAYALPDPLIGYQPAYGNAYNVDPPTADGTTQIDRAIVAVAVKNGFAVVVLTYGPLLPSVTPSSTLYWNGHPSPANLNMAYFGGDSILNSVLFP
jgi:hypothetical protein